jgi:hypothetical protein
MAQLEPPGGCLISFAAIIAQRRPILLLNRLSGLPSRSTASRVDIGEDVFIATRSDSPYCSIG